MLSHPLKSAPLRSFPVRVALDVGLVLLAVATGMTSISLVWKCKNVLIYKVGVVQEDSGLAVEGFQYVLGVVWLIVAIAILLRYFSRAGTILRTLLIGCVGGAVLWLVESPFPHILLVQWGWT